jgi:hypothetical protein
LRSEHISTAQKHAFLSLRKAPFSLQAWRLMFHTTKRSIKCSPMWLTVLGSTKVS